MYLRQSDHDKINAKLDELESEWFVDYEEELRIEHAEELAWVALQTQWLYEDAVQLEEFGETLNDLSAEIQIWTRSKKRRAVFTGILGVLSDLTGDSQSAKSFYHRIDIALAQHELGKDVESTWISGYANDRAQLRSSIKAMSEKINLDELKRKNRRESC